MGTDMNSRIAEVIEKANQEVDTLKELEQLLAQAPEYLGKFEQLVGYIEQLQSAARNLGRDSLEALPRDLRLTLLQLSTDHERLLLVYKRDHNANTNSPNLWLGLSTLAEYGDEE